MKRNQKGYMLVEIVIASVLAMTIAFYLLNLTYQFKDTDEDIYQSITYMNEKTIITKNIMNDLERGIVSGIDSQSSNDDLKNSNKMEIKFRMKLKTDTSIEEKRTLKIEITNGKTTIYYGKVNDYGNYIATDTSYFQKTLQKSLQVDVNNIMIDNLGSYLSIRIPLHSLYEKKSYDINLLVQQEWEDFLLNQAPIGSYVAYTGNNGCPSSKCDGTNANYVDSTNKGYCYNASYRFKQKGWRVAYTKENTAYLVTAGSPECLCTSANGTFSNTTCTDSLSETVYNKHINQLNKNAQKYCNPEFAYHSVCNENSAWNINEKDFQAILEYPINPCINIAKKEECGYGNDLIDNGGFYWYAYGVASPWLFNWYPYAITVGNQFVGGSHVSQALGIRPVVRLKDTVKVIGGSGTSLSPYKIIVE